MRKKAKPRSKRVIKKYIGEVIPIDETSTLTNEIEFTCNGAVIRSNITLPNINLDCEKTTYCRMEVKRENDTISLRQICWEMQNQGVPPTSLVTATDLSADVAHQPDAVAGSSQDVAGPFFVESSNPVKLLGTSRAVVSPPRNAADPPSADIKPYRVKTGYNIKDLFEAVDTALDDIPGPLNEVVTSAHVENSSTCDVIIHPFRTVADTPKVVHPSLPSVVVGPRAACSPVRTNTSSSCGVSSQIRAVVAKPSHRDLTSSSDLHNIVYTSLPKAVVGPRVATRKNVTSSRATSGRSRAVITSVVRNPSHDDITSSRVAAWLSKNFPSSFKPTVILAGRSATLAEPVRTAPGLLCIVDGSSRAAAIPTRPTSESSNPIAGLTKVASQNVTIVESKRAADSLSRVSTGITNCFYQGVAQPYETKANSSHAAASLYPDSFNYRVGLSKEVSGPLLSTADPPCAVPNPNLTIANASYAITHSSNPTVGLIKAVGKDVTVAESKRAAASQVTTGTTNRLDQTEATPQVTIADLSNATASLYLTIPDSFTCTVGSSKESSYPFLNTADPACAVPNQNHTPANISYTVTNSPNITAGLIKTVASQTINVAKTKRAAARRVTTGSTNNLVQTVPKPHVSAAYPSRASASLSLAISGSSNYTVGSSKESSYPFLNTADPACAVPNQNYMPANTSYAVTNSPNITAGLIKTVASQTINVAKTKRAAARRVTTGSTNNLYQTVPKPHVSVAYPSRASANLSLAISGSSNYTVGSSKESSSLILNTADPACAVPNQNHIPANISYAVANSSNLKAGLAKEVAGQYITVAKSKLAAARPSRVTTGSNQLNNLYQTVSKPHVSVAYLSQAAASLSLAISGSSTCTVGLSKEVSCPFLTTADPACAVPNPNHIIDNAIIDSSNLIPDLTKTVAGQNVSVAKTKLAAFRLPRVTTGTTNNLHQTVTDPSHAAASLSLAISGSSTCTVGLSKEVSGPFLTTADPACAVPNPNHIIDNAIIDSSNLISDLTKAVVGQNVNVAKTKLAAFRPPRVTTGITDPSHAAASLSLVIPGSSDYTVGSSREVSGLVFTTADRACAVPNTPRTVANASFAVTGSSNTTAGYSKVKAESNVTSLSSLCNVAGTSGRLSLAQASSPGNDFNLTCNQHNSKRGLPEAATGLTYDQSRHRDTRNISRDDQICSLSRNIVKPKCKNTSSFIKITKMRKKAIASILNPPNPAGTMMSGQQIFCSPNIISNNINMGSYLIIPVTAHSASNVSTVSGTYIHK